MQRRTTAQDGAHDRGGVLVKEGLDADDLVPGVKVPSQNREHA